MSDQNENQERIDREQQAAEDHAREHNIYVQGIVAGTQLSNDIDHRHIEDYSDKQDGARLSRQLQVEATTITLPNPTQAEQARLDALDAADVHKIDAEQLVGITASDSNAVVMQDRGENDLNDPDDTHRDLNGKYDLSEGDAPASVQGIAPAPGEDEDLVDPSPAEQAPETPEQASAAAAGKSKKTGNK